MSFYRFLALNLGNKPAPFTMFNPEITTKSAETFSLWDDCMSFPHLMVKLRRHKHISVRFQNIQGKRRTSIKVFLNFFSMKLIFLMAYWLLIEENPFLGLIMKKTRHFMIRRWILPSFQPFKSNNGHFCFLMLTFFFEFFSYFNLYKIKFTFFYKFYKNTRVYTSSGVKILVLPIIIFELC